MDMDLVAPAFLESRRHIFAHVSIAVYWRMAKKARCSEQEGSNKKHMHFATKLASSLGEHLRQFYSIGPLLQERIASPHDTSNLHDLYSCKYITCSK